jgi:hypothetical protein
MDYADYIRGISFRFFQPQADPARFHNSARRLKRLGLSLEVLNTRLPVDASAARKRLRPLLDVPRMSTFAIAAMINEGVRRMPAGQRFVNVGVWCGFTYFAGLVGNTEKSCVGVDNFSEFGSPRDLFLQRFDAHRSASHRFYEMDFADYFRDVHRAPIGFYIYDGSHDYASQLEGLRAAEPFFAPGCVVLVDDTNWNAPRQAALDFVAQSRYEYRTLLDATTRENLHPTLWNGLMIFRREG